MGGLCTVIYIEQIIQKFYHFNYPVYGNIYLHFYINRIIVAMSSMSYMRALNDNNTVGYIPFFIMKCVFEFYCEPIIDRLHYYLNYFCVYQKHD